MTNLIHNPLFDSIKEYFQNNNSKDKTIFLFAPYIKTDILSELLSELQNKIVIITTWKPQDLQLGSSEIQLYTFCKQHNITLYIHENMHLKVYSVELNDAILATGNISKKGLQSGNNYEAAIKLEALNNKDRMFFEKIRNESRFVDDKTHDLLKQWLDSNTLDLPGQTSLNDIIPAETKDDFLISALPMSHNIDDLVSGYNKISTGKSPSDNPETQACIFHDLANYNIDVGFSESEFLEILSERFFAHPFIQKIDKLITAEGIHFGRIKAWVQANCTDVPIPSRRTLTKNVQVLLEWFEQLGHNKYKIDIPGSYSQRIRKID